MNSINWPALSVWVFVAQLVEHCRVQRECKGHGFASLWSPQKLLLWATSQLLKLRFNCDGHIFISFGVHIIPAVHIIHSVPFLSRVDELNKLRAVSVWVFVAQLVEHCNAIAEAEGSNPVEAPKNYYFWLLRNCLNCDSTAVVTSSFHLYSHRSNHFVLYKWKHKILRQVKTGKHKHKRKNKAWFSLATQG